MIQVRFTTAEQAYDYGGVSGHEVAYVDNKGKRFRCVTIPNSIVFTQCDRYGSGLHQSYSLEEFTIDLEHGYYVKPAPL